MGRSYDYEQCRTMVRQTPAYRSVSLSIRGANGVENSPVVQTATPENISKAVN